MTLAADYSASEGQSHVGSPDSAAIFEELYETAAVRSGSAGVQVGRMR